MRIRAYFDDGAMHRASGGSEPAPGMSMDSRIRNTLFPRTISTFNSRFNVQVSLQSVQRRVSPADNCPARGARPAWDIECNCGGSNICNDRHDSAHHKNHIRLLLSPARPNTEQRLVMSFTGHPVCYRSGSIHRHRREGGFIWVANPNQARDYRMLIVDGLTPRNNDLTQMQVFHELGHAFGPDDHFYNRGSAAANNCIYGYNRRNSTVMRDLMLCAPCHNIIWSNRFKFYHLG